MKRKTGSCVAERLFGLLALACSCGDDGATATTVGGTDSSTGAQDDSSADSSSNSLSSTSASTGTGVDSSSSGESTDDAGSSDGGSTGGETGASDDGVESSSTGEIVEPIPCPAGEIPNMPLGSVMGSTLAQDDDFGGTCGGAGAPDMAFTFTAPMDGDYLFDTFGSQIDTVLYILDGTCMGDVVDCSDDDIGTASLVGTSMIAGQTVTVVVDGFGVAGGNFTLTAREGTVACPQADLGMVEPQSVMGQTIVATNDFEPSCGAGGAADMEFLFTAPSDGAYIVDTFGPNTDFDTVVFALDGSCMGPEIGCNNDAPGQFGPSVVVLDLVAGQQVTLGVEGYFGDVGNFELTIELFDGSVTCPQADLGNTVPQSVMGQTIVATDNFAPTCAGNDSTDSEYLFTAPADGTYLFDTIGSQFDTVLMATDGVCDGSEIACNDFYDPNAVDAGFALDMTAGEQITLIVDGNFGAGGEFTLNIGQTNGTCPDQDLGNMFPVMVNGSTAGGTNAGGGSCGGLFSNDYSYTWTAPAAGFYQFNTLGSTYDTVLYVLDGACDGPELGCNNDISFVDQTSRIGEQLAAGQSVVVVVDGNGAGDYMLAIDTAVSGGDCCTAHPGVGCEVQEIEDCVCALDPFCCNNSWDGACAGEAVEPCGAVCP